MRWRLPLAAAAAAILLFPLGAAAFGTIHGLGQDAEHEKIIRMALAGEGFEPATLDEIAGKRGTFGAVGAPDLPGRGLIDVAAAHCDGGDHLAIPGYPQGAAAAEAALTACRTWIFDHIEAAVAAAGELLDARGRIRDSQIPTRISCSYNGVSGRAKCNVLEALGIAFHAAQDFYSHTNWTDADPGGRPSPAAPPGLAGQGAAPWIDPARPGAFPPGLISGCFEGIPESLYCEDRVRHAILNKDTGAIDAATGEIGEGTSPRARGNDNFRRAVEAAVADTRAKWRHFRDRLIAVHGAERGQAMICAMLRDDPARTCG